MWVTSSQGAIYKLEPADGKIKVLDSYATNFGVFPSSRASGLVWDGAHLWLQVDNRLTRVDETIQSICTIDLPEGLMWQWKGLAWDGRFLWVIRREANKLYRVDPQICE